MKLGSYKYQVQQRLIELARFGESKHLAKQAFRRACEEKGIPWNPAQADGVFDTTTMESYRQTALEFAKWLRQVHPESKDLVNAPRERAIEYLQYRQRKGLSPYTISKDMSALNKICNLNITKKEAGLHNRSYKDVTRSRLPRAHDKQYNPASYERPITFAKAFGCRRASILRGKFRVKDVSLFRYEGKVYASLIEKGGRYREAPCLASMQSQIERMFPDIQTREPMTKREFELLYTSKEGGYLFSRYTTKIDNHAFRSQYACQLYEELLAQVEQNQPRKMYRGYDKAIVKAVSEALGHGRLSVVVESYFR